MNKILLMYITYGSGHHSAARAIERAIKSVNPHSEVSNIDGFEYVHPFMEKVIHALYMGIINKLPCIWNFLYDNPSIMSNINKAREKINKNNRIKIKRLIEEGNYKVVVCSQAFPCGMIADYKKHYYTNLKLIAVVTDFVPHSYWVYDEVDYYIVGCQEAKIILINKGVKEEKIRILGIPIDYNFNLNIDKNSIVRELNIDANKPVILIMGGGRGIGPIKNLIKTLDQSINEANLLVITGMNRRLFNYINNSHFRNNVIAYGFIDYVDKLMALADILVTKPGGITTAEAISRGLPMVIIKPLPGQEQNNANYLLRHGIAQNADNTSNAAKKIIDLLKDKEKLNILRQEIFKEAKPDSSLKIAELVLSLC